VFLKRPGQEPPVEEVMVRQTGQRSVVAARSKAIIMFWWMILSNASRLVSVT